MTDTTTEAVDRLAGMIERHQDRKANLHRSNPRYAAPDDRYAHVPATLRALAAERDRLRAEVARLVALVDASPAAPGFGGSRIVPCKEKKRDE